MGKRHLVLLSGLFLALLWAILPAGAGTPRTSPMALAARGVIEPGSVTFTTAGDFSSSSAAGQVLDTIDEVGSDLTLALGDLSYGTAIAEQAWCDFVTSRVGAGYPFELISGNHESNGQNGDINDFSACLPNQLPGAVGTYGRQWYVDVPAAEPLVRFVMISPDLAFPEGTYQYTAGSARYQWTANAIDQARTAGIPWVVVGMHKPCLSVGQYGCAPGKDLLNLLLAKRVDLVLSGHEHLYQRTSQLALGSGCPELTAGTFDADCVVDSDSALTGGAGTVLATVGTGGVALRAADMTDPDASYFDAVSAANMAPSHGVLEVATTTDSMSLRFVASGSGSFTDAVTINRGAAPANQPPTAAFTEQVDGLSVSTDGSASSDPDGTVSSYSWDWGDGTPDSTGATASHTYATAGSYTVALTVTDDKGRSNTAFHTVVVTAPGGSGQIAADAFGRTLTGGWGAADVGGSWTAHGGASAFSVGGGVGSFRLLSPGAVVWASLEQIRQTSADLTLTFTADKSATGSGIYVQALGRDVPGVGSYRAQIGIAPNGSLRISLLRRTPSGAQTFLTPEVAVPGISHVPGQQLRLRLLVTGSGTTDLHAKLWRSGSPEPTGWTVSATDSTPSFQGPGGVGIGGLLSRSATNTPITVTVDDFAVRSAG